MNPPSMPADEKGRLAALRELLILDTPPEERFDRITAFAQSEFDVPTVLVSGSVGTTIRGEPSPTPLNQ